MSSRSLSLALCLLLPVLATADDAQYDAVRALGESNGVALQCKYLDQVRRMKAAVVQYAPKERSFGLAFDEATNTAFLAFVRGGGPCPDHETLERRVGHQIDALGVAFAAAP